MDGSVSQNIYKCQKILRVEEAGRWMGNKFY